MSNKAKIYYTIICIAQLQIITHFKHDEQRCYTRAVLCAEIEALQLYS